MLSGLLGNGEANGDTDATADTETWCCSSIDAERETCWDAARDCCCEETRETDAVRELFCDNFDGELALDTFWDDILEAEDAREFCWDLKNEFEMEAEVEEKDCWIGWARDDDRLVFAKE